MTIPKAVKEKLKSQVVVISKNGRTPDNVYLEEIEKSELFGGMDIVYGVDFLNPNFFLSFAKGFDIAGIVFADTAKDGRIIRHYIDRKGLKMIYNLLEKKQGTDLTTWQLIKNEWYLED